MLSYLKWPIVSLLYRTKFEDLVEQYIAKLEDNPLFFEAKIERLYVKFTKAPDGKRSNGVFISRGRDISIEYHINPNDPHEFVLYVLAHELAHCLFWNGNIILSDYCKSDESYGRTFVQRTTNQGNYGSHLEDCLSDYMAVATVCSLEHNLSPASLANIIATVNPNSHFANGVFDITMKIIDVFNLKGTKLNFDAPFDKLVDLGNDMVFPQNVLLYEVCYGDLSTLITEYNYVMGKKSSWRKLNSLLKDFVSSPNDFSRHLLLSELTHFCFYKENN